MMKQYNISVILCLSLAVFFSPMRGQDILKILEGYGRDSTTAYSTDDAQEEAAKLFNIILETDGEIAVQRAEQLLTEGHSPLVKSYLCVMLADYAFVNKRDQQGLQYLQRAAMEYKDIRNDSYYKLIYNRAQKSIEESPGKTEEHKNTAIADFSPQPLKEEKQSALLESGKSPAAPAAASTVKTPEKSPAYRIQVGAFSQRENAQRKEEFYRKEGYEVQVEERKSSYGSLLLIRVGAFESYEEAREALSRLKAKYPDEEGIVVKTAIK